MQESGGIGLQAEASNRRKRRLETRPNRSPKPAAPHEPLGPSHARSDIYYKINQNKDLFMAIRLAEHAFEQLK
jgi:hypothetical protein